MALRRQLLLLASLTLVLPWAGYEYVREMETSLRQGQEAALAATAQAVAARITSDPFLVENLQQSLAPLARLGASDLFYVHRLPGAVVVDGYPEEWRDFNLAETRLQKRPESRVFWGSREGLLFGFVHVKDMDRQFYDPARPLAEADRLEFLLDDGSALRLFSAAQGAVSVERHLGEGVWQREHRLSGVWNELEDGFAVEIRLPLNWVANGIAVAAYDGSASGGEASPHVRAVVRREADYDEALAIFARAGVRLSLVTQGGWLIGTAGRLHVREPSLGREDLVRLMIRRILGHPDFPKLPPDQQDGRVVGDLNASFDGQYPGARWYRWDDSLLGRVAIPVAASDDASSVPLFLVAEQTMDSLDSLTTGAVGRLLWYTALATALAGLTLLAYASVLSLRVRRLSRATQRAVDSDGRIRGHLPSSRSRDEIGDLARSFAALLQRLQEYNHYLESLAGKLSHELRTPLAIVRTSLDNLSQIGVGNDQRVYLERASEGASRLSKLLNAMSAAARLEQTLQHSDLERIDCGDLLTLLTQSYASLYAPRSVAMRKEGDGPFWIMAVPEAIAQMCDKLLENAADFTGENGAIELLLARQQQDVQLQVINTGPALPVDLQDRIFDSLTSTRAGEGQHLGLGLYVVRMIVRFHKGRVRAFNHPAGGRVVFEVLLPATE